MAEVSRSAARQRAVEVLFESEQRQANIEALLQERLAGLGEPVSPYAAQLVRGVISHLPRIDELISTYAQGWTIDRLPAVDRQVLRVGMYELMWENDVPDAVCVDEAVTLAKKLSTDESPNFVNGLLGRVMDLKPGLMLDD